MRKTTFSAEQNFNGWPTAAALREFVTELDGLPDDVQVQVYAGDSQVDGPYCRMKAVWEK